MTTLLTLWRVLGVIHALYPPALGVAIAYAFKLALRDALRHAQLAVRTRRQRAAAEQAAATGAPEREPALIGGAP